MIKTVLSYFDASTCIVGLVITLVVLYIKSRQPKNLPPSPGIALPFVGHFHKLKKNPRQQLKKWADKYGDVFTFQMGPETSVFINTMEAMKEAFVKKADYFSDRPNSGFLTRRLPYFSKGIISSSGANWKAQRTTSLAILRNFGMGKNMLAEKITDEVSFLTKELAKKNGKPCDIRYLTNMSVCNVICSIIFGKRFEFDNPIFIGQMKIVNDFVMINSGVLILNFLPLLYYLPFDLFKGKRLIEIVTQIRKFSFEMINEIKAQYDPDNLDNYIVAYINEMKKEEQAGEISYLDEDNLSLNIGSLFIAGTETTSTTIMWCLLYILNYPDVQKRIYDEIVEHIGTERSPIISDKQNLKYLTAFIMEVQRKASIAPLAVPHLCTSDATLSGYNIPKGTLVIPNLDAIHFSEAIWGDPQNFRPERFIDNKGNIISREELIPFSIGRRICLGESLAKMELFLYLSTLFQKFEFLPPSPGNVPPLNVSFGGAAAPEQYEIRCVERSV